MGHKEQNGPQWELKALKSTHAAGHREEQETLKKSLWKGLFWEWLKKKVTSLRQLSLCMKGLNDLPKEELNLRNFPDDLVIASKVFGVW